MEVITDYIAFEESFFVMVAFFGFIALFLKYAWPKVASLLDGRSDQIQTQLIEATKLREEAQATLSAYQKRQREVMEETEKMLDHAKLQVETMQIDAEADLRDSVNRRLAQAKQRIARAEEQAVAHVQEHITTVSLGAAETLIAEMIQENGDDTLVSAAIEDAPRLAS